MRKDAAPTTVERSAALLRGLDEQRVTDVVADRISRAFLAAGDARELALDYNARLVTELRVLGTWPARYGEDEEVCQG